MKKKILIIIPTLIVVIGVAVILFMWFKNSNIQNPEEVLKQYFSYIEQENYEELYNMVKLPEEYSKEDFFARNKNIYQGIDAENIQIEIKSVEKEKKNWYDMKKSSKREE